MLVIVVAMFGICWLPLHVFILILDYHPDIYQQADPEFLIGVYTSVHWLAMSNSFANPIIYGFMNESFRADLITLFYMWFPCCICCTKMLPRHSSGSTYETVVFRRQSLNRYSGKNGNRSVKSLKGNKNTQNGTAGPVRNGYNTNLKRNGFSVSQRNGNDFKAGKWNTYDSNKTRDPNIGFQRAYSCNFEVEKRKADITPVSTLARITSVSTSNEELEMLEPNV